MARKKESTPGENLAKQIIEQYNPKSEADMQDAVKDIFGPMFEAMLQGEMNNHLGYESNDHGAKSTDNRRNGYTSKKIKTTGGEVEIKVPRDRDSSFEPKLVPKRQRDVSEIEEKVLAMYARGMSQRDIAETSDDIYGFEISHEMISQITDCVLDELSDWQNRPLKKMYTFLFVDCIFVVFIAQIVRAYMLNNLTDYMRKNTCTMKKILNELDKIKCFAPRPTSSRLIDPLTKNQRELYSLLTISPPECIG